MLVNGVNKVSPDPATVSTALETVDKSLGWIDKVVGYLKPFKPEAKSMRVNYRDSNAEISLRIHIPDQMKREIEKVEVPIYPGFSISEFLDETFTQVKANWYEEDGKWKLKPSELPHSEYYLLRLKGRMHKSAISNLVRIQPAKNRDQTEEMDRYWLDVMIRDVEMVEKIWKQLQIEEVNLNIRVGVERPFSTAIPKEMSEKLKATQAWIRTGLSGNRSDMIRQMQNLRSTARSTKVQPEDIVEGIIALTKRDTFMKYLSVEKPYDLGEAKRDEELIDIFPRFMVVEAFTDLNLKIPAGKRVSRFSKEEV